MRFTIKQARQYAGLTQDDMAARLHICTDTYRRIEKYPEKATISQAYSISQITGIDLDEIFFDS